MLWLVEIIYKRANFSLVVLIVDANIILFKIKIMFIERLTQFTINTKFANGNHITTKSVKKIKLWLWKEDGSVSSTTFNDILYV